MAPREPDRIHALRWAILAVMCLSLVLIVMANSVLNVSLPTLVRELGASGTELQWIVDAYALVFGGLLLTMGAVGDRFGRRGALQVGLLIFGAASLLSVFAEDATFLIGTRALMGVGGALVMPATLSIIAHVFPREERGKAMGIWAAFAGVGAAIGPVVGGWLLEHFSWQSIFYLNLPVVAIALVAGVFLVPTSKDPTGKRLDLVGALLSIIALASLLYGIIQGPEEGWISWQVLTAFGATLFAWPAFLLWERQAKAPMLPLGFFRNRGFTTGNAAIALAFFVMFAFFFVGTQYLQFVRDYSPLQAGIRTLPLAAGLIIAAPQSDRLAGRFGTPNTVTLGLSFVALGLAGLSLLTTTTPYWMLAVGFLVLGLGMGTAMAPGTTLIMDSIPPNKAGVGSAMNDTSREVGGAMGIAVLGSIVNSVFRDRASATLPDGMAPAMRAAAEDSVGAALQIARQVGGETGAAIARAANDAFVDALAWAFGAAAVIAVIAAIGVRLLMPRRAAFAGPTGDPDGEAVPTTARTHDGRRSEAVRTFRDRAAFHAHIDDLYDDAVRVRAAGGRARR